MFMNNNRLFLFTLLALIWSCQKSETESFEIEDGRSYFPLEIGRSWEYTVDSILYDPTANGTLVDSSKTLVREVIVDTLILVDNSVSYIFERFERADEGAPWQIKRVWSMRRTENQALRVEDNLQFIKMIFPSSTRSTLGWKLLF